jgi:DNA-binding MarR family transcriptional regulator
MTKHIASRYNCFVAKKITSAEFQALAELRYRIRLFLREGDAAARLAGLEPQQYLMLLAIRGLAPETPPKIQIFADRLALKHHSAVELVDRLEQRGYVKRTRSREDRREVLVSLLPRGEKLLERAVQQRIGELRASGRELVSAIEPLLRDGRTRNDGGRDKAVSSSQRVRSRSEKSKLSVR